MESQQVGVKHSDEHVDEEALDGTFSGDSRWLEAIELTDFRSSVLNFSRLPCDTPGRPDVEHLPHLSLTALIESVEAQFDAKKNLFESKHGVDACKKLSRDEIMTIMAYTSATPALYLSLNAWMMVRRDQIISAIIGPFARRLITALGKLPELKCRAYRGVKVDGVAGLEKAYNNAGEILGKGSSVNFWGFCSFSTNADVAKNFATDPKCATARSIVYTCDEIRGVSVDCLSIAPREEHEVLLIPPALFRVEKVMGPTEGRISLTISQLDSWDKEYILPLRPNPSSNLTVVVHSEIEFDCLDLTFPYFTKKLDVNRVKCLALFGMRPGEKVKTTSGQVATLVGMAPHQGVLSLWFHVEGESSITRFNDGEVLVRQLQFCDLQNSSDGAGAIKVAAQRWASELNYSDTLSLTFPFRVAKADKEVELFDTTADICLGLFGIPALQRCSINDALVTAVGAARVKGKLRMFFVADGSNEAVSFPPHTPIDVLETTSPGLDAAPHQTSKVTRLIAVKASSAANSILSCNVQYLDSQRQKKLFDVQHCEELFGVASGQRAIANSDPGTVVGVQGATNGPVLWFHRDGAAGAEALAAGTPLLFLNETQVVIANSKESASASKAVETITVAEYDIDTDEFCFDYPYKCGTMHSRLELFDRRSEECSGLFSVVPGQRVRDSLVGIGATAIGMRLKPDGKLAMWYHVDGSTGAGIYEEGTVLTVIPGDVRQLPAAPVAANASQSFVTSKKVALPAEPLQLTFRYPAGVGRSRELPFDIRRDVCLQQFGVEPGRRVRVHGDLATAIGMREDEGKLTMWYHDDDNGGAGLYAPGSIIELTPVVVPIDRLAVLAEVPAEMIDLNLSERAPVTGGGSELFDVRPEPCVKFFRLCPGQRVRVLKTQQEATVVGMRNAAGRVQLWLSDVTGARSYSAGTAIEVLDGELAPTGQSDHQLVVNHLPFDPSMELQQTFCYQTGARDLSGEAMFDVREDVCRGLFGVAPGQRVLSDVGMATAVGMKHLPDGTLAMWYHLDGSPGAGTFLAGSSLTVTGSTVKLSPFVDGDSAGTIVTFNDDLPREPLQLDFQYRSGGSVTESELRRKMGSDFDEARLTRYFDVRPEICQRFGVLSGQRVRVQGHEATAIGAAPDGGFLKMWYHHDGRYGAGLYPAGTEVRLTNKFVSLLAPPRQGDVRMSPPKPIAEPQREKEKSPLQKSAFQANPQAPNSAATNRVACEPVLTTGEDFIVKDVAVQPLELTVPFPRGKSKVSSMFDCRPEKCLELFGVSIGQKFVRDNGKVTTVFGVAQSGSGSVATIKLFFCEDGAEFVGAYPLGAKLTFYYPPEDDLLD